MVSSILLWHSPGKCQCCGQGLSLVLPWAQHSTQWGGLHTCDEGCYSGGRSAWGRSVFQITSLLLHFPHEQGTSSPQAMDNQDGAYRNYFIEPENQLEIKLLWHILNPEILTESLYKFLCPLLSVVLLPSHKAVDIELYQVHRWK